MSTSATTPNSSPIVSLDRVTKTRGRVTQVGVFRSEWTKLRSVRSSLYTLLAVAVLTIAIGIIAAAADVSRWSSMSASEKASFDPLFTSFLGVSFAALAIGVLGVLLISGEYTTGMIRSTMTAVPRRLPVLWAKSGVFALVALAVAIPSALIAFFASQAILSGKDIQIAFSHAGVARAVVGAGVYLALAGLFAMGLGAILRNTAAGIGSFVGIMFVLPSLISLLPSSVSNSITPYLPSNAGEAMMKIGHHAHTLSAGAGAAVFAGYVALAIAAAAVLLVRRDV